MRYLLWPDVGCSLSVHSRWIPSYEFVLNGLQFHLSWVVGLSAKQ